MQGFTDDNKSGCKLSLAHQSRDTGSFAAHMLYAEPDQDGQCMVIFLVKTQAREQRQYSDVGPHCLAAVGLLL